MTQHHDDAKAAILREIDRLEPTLRENALFIWAHPEIGYQEVKASARHADFLEAEGFEVERGILNMSTAFRATVVKGSGPKIAMLAEYDALPNGHACGHNLGGTAVVGAAAALAKVLPCGTLTVFGTPAEEGIVENAGAKVLMTEAGLFDGYDVAMTAHADAKFTLRYRLVARALIDIDFFGVAAHGAACPEKGVNAQDAAMLTMAGVNALRQHATSDVRIMGLITSSGTAVNVIPDHASLRFSIRAEDKKTFEETVAKVLRCAEHCALALGCTSKAHQSANPVLSARFNDALLDAMGENLKMLGVDFVESVPTIASSDIGNVSWRVPTIHPYFKVGPEGITQHNDNFAEACRSEVGLRGMLAYARALAMTGYDFAAKPELQAAVRKDFEEKVASRV